ncbi:MAG: DUF2975 domain-containing protein [Flavobacterium sp.]|nr:DUF2975 domain-containing protein [Flavobacterium sp.]
MKIINWVTNKYLLGAMIISSIGCIIYAFLILLFLLFNFNPFYQSKTFALGYNIKDGLEIEVRDDIKSDKDTTILFKTQKGKQGKTQSLDSAFMNETIGNDSITQLDTILRTYEIFNWTTMNEQAQFTVGNFDIQAFSIKIKPTTTIAKYVVWWPQILTMLLYAYVLYQFAMFLHFIQQDASFEFVNYKRLRNIGFSLLGFQLLGYLYNWIFNHYTISVDTISTLPHFKNYLYFSGAIKGTSGIYLVIGIFFLILAKAFQRGNNLQKEQDLTI